MLDKGPIHSHIGRNIQRREGSSDIGTSSNSHAFTDDDNNIIPMGSKPSNRSVAQSLRRQRERMLKMQTRFNINNNSVLNSASSTYSTTMTNGTDDLQISTTNIDNIDSTARLVDNMLGSHTTVNTISKRSLGQVMRRQREKRARNLENLTTQGENQQRDNQPICGSGCSFAIHNHASSSSSATLENLSQPYPTSGRRTDEDIISKKGINTTNNTFHATLDMNDGIDHEVEPTTIAQYTTEVLPQPTERHFLGLMNRLCPFCKALHWIDERLKDSSIINPIFGTCCKSGKVKLPKLRPPPLELRRLYEGNDSLSTSFLKYIREYNAANAFTSLGCQLDNRTMGTRGIKSFTIHGELRHRTGALLPDIGTTPIYSQLYIYDPNTALNFRYERNKHLNKRVLQIIQMVLLRDNYFTELYRQAFDILQSSSNHGYDLPVCLQYNKRNDKRVYNMPSVDEIAVVIPGDGTQISGSRDIMIHLRGGTHLERISECHPAYLPLHYVLLFPNGDLGWDINHTKWNPTLNCPSSKRLTQQPYYSYRLFEREDEYSTILLARKLLQEFIVDGWACTEQNRLQWARNHQTDLRRDLYSGITDIETDVLQADQIGKRYILPSSFIGTPRHMYEIYQDSLAITRYNKHPDIFLTMTANPSWLEILQSIKPNQKPHDRPDIIARVFELKRRSLMEEIVKNGILGSVVAHVYTIEFQKRGLPHMHALFFLKPSDKIRTIDQVNKLICAEFPSESERPLLFETVKKCMVHGPCKGNKHAPCMENEKCSKRYPRDWAETTTMDQDGYPIYRRRNDGQSYIVKGVNVDNRDVVPYNPKLSEMYNCHINVEVCASVRAVKYIHKYIYKGHDRTTMVVGEQDEIKQYLDSRYIGPPEAAWHIFSYHMHEEKPPVIRLQLHLPGMHQVTFNPNESADAIKIRAQNQTSTLIEFFNFCRAYPEARQFTYQQFPEHFTWNKGTHMWSPRSTNSTAIGRMYFASPNSGERFYLRLLLTVTKGPTSFEDLRTVNGQLHQTFKDACIARGMLEDDDEWVTCLEEASIMNTGYQLRRLFCIILTQCSPLQPHFLWRRFAMNICDDLSHAINENFLIPNPSDYQIKDYGLHLIDKQLQESGKCLLDFPPMTSPTENWNVVFENRLIWEHKQLRYVGQDANAKKNILSFNKGQRVAYSKIYDSVHNEHGTTFFLNGGAGTGKTYLYNTIADKFRSLGHFVITVASSGIASLLLLGGRTAHSTFSLPLNILEDSLCGFTKQSMVAELLRKTSLIIWDEVPMQHRFCVETVDRSLRDIRDCPMPFGGITVVLGGDFRQILPVIPKGVREDIVSSTLRRSLLWKYVNVLTLDQNMRLDSKEVESANFAAYLDQVGSNPEPIVDLAMMHKHHTLIDLIKTIYPELNVSVKSPAFYNERTILSARNEDVNAINSTCLQLCPTTKYIFLAADKLVEDEENDRYPSEFLNSLECNGLPPFKLELKVGCPIILLRNLAPKDGLCNGTRLTVVRCATRIIEARILTGDKAGNLVFIPRISLQPSATELTINMSRRQFPIKLAYAMTINKAQGQSVKYVGIDLRTPVFAHGQLYVALSRCTTFNKVSVLLPTKEETNTTNVVYPEVLF